MTTATRRRRSPSDVERAHETWGANCGPAALAAILGIEVDDTQQWFPGFEQRGYVNPTHMREALGVAGIRYASTVKDPRNGYEKNHALPAWGLVFVQFSGGWWDHKPAPVQYRFAHWIAIETIQVGTRPDHAVYDVNARKWCTRQHWIDSVWPMLQDHYGCGDCWARWACEVRV